MKMKSVFFCLSLDTGFSFRSCGQTKWSKQQTLDSKKKNKQKNSSVKCTDVQQNASMAWPVWGISKDTNDQVNWWTVSKQSHKSSKLAMLSHSEQWQNSVRWPLQQKHRIHYRASRVCLFIYILWTNTMTKCPSYFSHETIIKMYRNFQAGTHKSKD